jgi:cytoskeleton protein RodZ
MSTSSGKNTEPEVPVEEGPGHRLRAAREAKKLSFSQVAAELHLGEGVVAALEQDEYGHLPGPVFVQGYLRKYARLLGESEELVIQAYHQLAPGGRSYSTAVGAPLDAGTQGSHAVARILIWLLLLGALALALAWWQGGFELPQMGSMDRAEAPSPAAMGQEPVYEEAPAQTEPVISSGWVEEELPAGPAEEMPVELMSEPVAEVAAEMPPVEEEAVAAPEVAPPEQPEVVAPLEAVEEVAAESAPSVPQAEADEQENLTAGVVLEFTATCWVDIRDASGRFKLLGNVPVGSRRVLEGVPPYAVILGNSQAVKITVNGQPFDLAPFSRGNVARFTLDPERLAETTP